MSKQANGGRRRGYFVLLLSVLILTTSGAAFGQAKFERSKPHLNVGTLGQSGHGKTALTSAITKVLAETGGADYVPVEQFKSARDRRVRILTIPGLKVPVLTIKYVHVEYETPTRHYAHVVSQDHTDTVKNLISGAAPMNAAILVVSAREGPTDETEAQVRLAGLVGLAPIVVYLNIDGDIDAEAMKQAESGIRYLLTESGFAEDEVPIVRGSAAAALADRDPELGRDSIVKLLAALDQVPLPLSAKERPFLMLVEDVFSIIAHGTVAMGRVERGVLERNQEGSRDRRDPQNPQSHRHRLPGGS
jgi:elongation factor Tu